MMTPKKQKMQLCILMTGFLFFLSGLSQLYATDNPYTLGVPSQLEIKILSGGRYCVYRGGKKQFANESITHLFAIKIGSTVYGSGGNVPLTPPEYPTEYTPITAVTGISNIEDMGAVTTGTMQEVTKKFSGSHGGNPFSVTLRITYNTTSPDYFIMHASIDASRIPSGTAIKFAHGFDSYVNGMDVGVAYIAPDPNNWNNPSTTVNRYLTTAQVQQLRIVGATNRNAATQGGSFIALFPIGRNFDRAYSAGDRFWLGNCYNIVELTQGGGGTSGNDNQYKFQFGPFDATSANDNGVGAGYDNITAGQVTEIRTGLTFTNTLDGELDYTWNNQKNLTANIGDNVNLNLSYNSYSSSTVNGIGFRVNFGGLKITGGGCSSSGFSAPGTSTCTPGNEYYQLSSASIVGYGSGTITVPVNITRAGRWVVSADSISNTSRTLPFSAPAILTVGTTVSLSDGAAALVVKGESKQFTVKYSGTHTAAEDVKIFLSYSGNIGSFSSMPASVTIPAGSNSAVFAVAASATGTEGHTVAITLSSTDQTFITIVNPSSVNLTIATQYSVDYNGNGHTSGTAPAGGLFIKDSSVPIAGPGDLQRTCHVFTGWATSPSAVTPDFVYDGTSFTPASFIITANTTLYAVWRDARYLIWTPSTSVAIGERTNWSNPANWTPQAVPMSCSNVFIPGNLGYYPVLKTANVAVCDSIFFMQGAELARPDLLTYNRAFVQYNLGLSQATQITNQNNANLLRSTTADRMKYSASASANPIQRERWYMLSSPLRGVVTGDLSFGGFPLTFLMKFGPVEKDGTNYGIGKWTTPYTGMNVPLKATEGFAFYVYGFQSGGTAERNLGCYETGIYGTLGEFPHLPLTRDLEPYGLMEMNGILELPFFEDNEAIHAHRTQVYESATRESKFYLIDDGSYIPANHNKLFGGEYDATTRDPNSGNYRFIPETYNSVSGKWEFQPQINHSGADLEGDADFMVGNPYLSSLNMVSFLGDNTATLQQNFKIWNGSGFLTYYRQGSLIYDAASGGNVADSLIAPLQGFFLTTLSGYVYNSVTNPNVATFDVTTVSTTRPGGMTNLRSSGAPENRLRIQAENGSAESFMLIGYDGNAGAGFKENTDVRKLFSPYGYVPEIYALAGETPADIRFINHNNREIIVPIGIRTEQKGEIRLTFSGMDNYGKASKIELFDAKENRTVDLTGKTSYTYAFNNTETGIQNGRFSLRFDRSPTSLQDVNVSDNLRVYSDSKGIYVISPSSDPVQKLEIYDFQGRKLYESASGASYYPVQDNFGKSPVIVRVITANQVMSYNLQLKIEN